METLKPTAMKMRKMMVLTEEWMVKAATKGRCRAQWFLYNVYMSGGTCFKKDADKAVMWMKKAVAQGYNQAYFMQEYQNSWMSKVDR